MNDSRAITRLILRLGLGLLLLAALYLSGMIGYAMLTDYQPPAQSAVMAEGQASQATASDTLTLITWNIGYAGQGAASDFFYDGGQSVRQSAEVVQGYLEGISARLRSWRDTTDLFLLQEVDRDSRRSYYQDQVAVLSQALPGYAAAFAPNYQVGFIPIPLLEPMGKVNGGLTTWSRMAGQEATRYQFEGNYDWPTYLFFLDRCFLLQRFAVDSSTHELVIINTHNSAYDDGSLKQRQMAQLRGVLLQEYQQGNYVIVGGDWNQYPSDFTGIAGYSVERTEANARAFVPKDYPAPDWHWARDLSVPTNRSLATPYDSVHTEQGVIDFFLTSPNVEVLGVEGINLDFAHSDHQPVRIRVALH
jgi:endonuclease/exonuclease/phosphatase family metal-dependent hydrolase